MKKHCLYFSKRPISAMRPLSVISVKAIEKNPSKEDCEKPCKYFLKAAEGEYRKACLKTAACYVMEKELKEDHEEAFKWEEKSG